MTTTIINGKLIHAERGELISVVGIFQKRTNSFLHLPILAEDKPDWIILKKFKLDAISLASEQGHTASKIPRGLEINVNMLKRRIKEYRTDDLHQESFGEKGNCPRSRKKSGN